MSEYIDAVYHVMENEYTETVFNKIRHFFSLSNCIGTIIAMVLAFFAFYLGAQTKIDMFEINDIAKENNVSVQEMYQLEKEELRQSEIQKIQASKPEIQRQLYFKSKAIIKNYETVAIVIGFLLTVFCCILLCRPLRFYDFNYDTLIVCLISLCILCALLIMDPTEWLI